MVEVFKTNVNAPEPAQWLIHKLNTLYPHYKINFDLEDCDKILRVAGELICNESIIAVLNEVGFDCVALD